MQTATSKDFFLMHFIVLIWGFTSIIGHYINQDATEMVFWRVVFTVLGLGAIAMMRGRSLSTDKNTALKLLSSGTLIAIHWQLFFLAIKVGNVSTCLAGVSTCALWTSLLEPLMNRRKISLIEVFLGILVILGLCIVFIAELEKAWGLAIAVLSAIFSAVFSIFNGMFIKRHTASLITFYQMIGAVLFLGIYLLIEYGISGKSLSEALPPSSTDWFLIFVLAIGCTVFPYVTAVELMKKFSAFAMNLSINMEPVYGITMAFFFLGKTEQMSANFYLGTLVILAAVFAYPMLNRRRKVVAEV